MMPWRTRRLRRVDPLVRSLQCGHGELPWRTAMRPASRNAAVIELQCGHGEFAVENSDGSCLRTLEPIGASMRPRRIRRGERSPCRRGRPARLTLQCGHGEFAVESSRLFYTAGNACRVRPRFRSSPTGTVLPEFLQFPKNWRSCKAAVSLRWLHGPHRHAATGSTSRTRRRRTSARFARLPTTATSGNPAATPGSAAATPSGQATHREA